eukprot:scaffold228793_cov22-Tisochrysis_lutea.AAC.1
MHQTWHWSTSCPAGRPRERVALWFAAGSGLQGRNGARWSAPAVAAAAAAASMGAAVAVAVVAAAAHES